MKKMKKIKIIFIWITSITIVLIGWISILFYRGLAEYSPFLTVVSTFTIGPAILWYIELLINLFTED